MIASRGVSVAVRLGATWLVVAFVAMLSACVPARPATQSSPAVTLKLVVLPRLSWAPFYIAQAEGFFAEEGLQVEFVQMERSADAVPLVAQGEIDVFAGTVNVGLMNAMARDARIKFVADKGYYAAGGCAYSGLLARRALVESGELASAAQLKGRKIAMDRGTFEGYYVGKLLGGAALTVQDVSVVEIPTTAAALLGLEDGSLDVASLSEPWLTRGIQGGYATIWMPVQQVIPDFQAGFVAYGPALLEKNPDAGYRFMLAYRKAVRQYNLGKTPRNLDILSEQLKLDRALLEAACWQPFREDGHINAQSVVDFQAWAVKEGFLDTPVGEERFWDARFLDRANQTLAAAAD